MEGISTKHPYLLFFPPPLHLCKLGNSLVSTTHQVLGWPGVPLELVELGKRVHSERREMVCPGILRSQSTQQQRSQMWEVERMGSLKTHLLVGHH